jgi:hypothetical protein
MQKALTAIRSFGRALIGGLFADQASPNPPSHGTQAEASATIPEFTAFSVGHPPIPGAIDRESGTVDLHLLPDVPYTRLIAHFKTGATSVKAAGHAQRSGETENDFSSPLIYTLIAEDGETRKYTVLADSSSAPDYFKAPMPLVGSCFGYSVALSDGILAIGAPFDPARAGEGGVACGAVYVYKRRQGRWEPQARIPSPNGHRGDCFGFSLALSGGTLVVGANEESRLAGDAGSGDTDDAFCGAAYVFVRRAAGWVLEERLAPRLQRAGDNFGYSVGVCGDTIVVGAPRESLGGRESGAAFVFAREGGHWTQKAYIKAPNVDPDDYFGSSVSISGDVIVVGAPFEAAKSRGVDGDMKDNSAPFSGAVYVYRLREDAWTREGYLKASNAQEGDNFGLSVSVSGDTLVVGAHLEASRSHKVNGGQSDNSQPFSGAAYVFERRQGIWFQSAYLKGSNSETYDWFGYSVAISQDLIIVGASGESSTARDRDGDQADNSAPFSGAAYLFSRSGLSWKQHAYLKASNTANGDGFGSSVAVSGHTIAVGAHSEDRGPGGQEDRSLRDSGAVYVY